MDRVFFFGRTQLRHFVFVAFAAIAALWGTAGHATSDGLAISGNGYRIILAGQSYSFTPTTQDPSGRKMAFSIANKPAWASFNSSTGQLSGTPGSTPVWYSGIQISVSDGVSTATLPGFAIEVRRRDTSPPVISGNPATTVSVGSAYSFLPSAKDPAGNPLWFRVKNKPSWASFNYATGQLSGWPTAANVGTYSNIVIWAGDDLMTASLPAFSIQVKGTTASPSPTVSLSASPASISKGAAAMLSWSASNASSCSASGGWSGSKGMSGSSSTGALSATMTYTLTCNGASGTTAATKTATVAVSGASGGSLSITSPGTLPAATDGGSYFYQLQASGGTPPYLWSLNSGSGTTSWYVTPGGWLEGAPTSNESDALVVTVTDAASHTAQGTFSVTVNSNLAVMGQDFLKGRISLPGASVGAGYRHTLQAAGGTSPYSWSIASGSLPAGLTLSSAGVITGTPSAAGNFSGIVFHVTDNTNATATANASLVVAAAQHAARPSYNTGSGFFVYNGKLYDPNGDEFRIRGVNLTHFDSNSYPGIVKAQANTVRYGMYLINTAPATPNAATYEKGAATQYVANGVFTIIADFYTTPGDGASAVTGNTNPTVLADIVSWWVANEATFAPIMDRIAINIANEWGPAGSTVWRDSYITAITRLRAAGYSCPLVIDSGSWGQDPQDFLNYGQAVLDSDPQKNVIFSLHIYSDFYDSGGGVSKTYNTQPDLQAVTDALVASGLPIIYGEFGPGRNLNGPQTLIAPARVVEIAEAAGFGWMPWSWDSNNLGGGASNNSSFSMTFQGPGLYSAPSSLTWYGLDMALNPAHGWNALASPAPVFVP